MENSLADYYKAKHKLTTQSRNPRPMQLCMRDAQEIVMEMLTVQLYSQSLILKPAPIHTNR